MSDPLWKAVIEAYEGTSVLCESKPIPYALDAMRERDSVKREAKWRAVAEHRKRERRDHALAVARLQRHFGRGQR